MLNDFSSPELSQMVELAERQLAGLAAPAELSRLESLLLQHPGLRSEYLKLAELHGHLQLLSRRESAEATSADGTCTAAPSARTTPAAQSISRRPSAGWHRSLLAGLTGLMMLGVCVWWSAAPPVVLKMAGPVPDAAPVEGAPDYYDLIARHVRAVGSLSEDPRGILYPTTLRLFAGETRFQTTQGASVQIAGPAAFGASSHDGGVLFSGTVQARVADAQASFSVLTPNLRIVDLGTEFRVTTLDEQQVRVDVLDGEVEIQSRIRRPVYYWNFDDPELLTREFRQTGRVAVVPGLIGPHAVQFDNSREAGLHSRVGTGPEVGTGELACSSGLSLEALFVSRWTGDYLDYDEIFRKEDGPHRILLSFQNDRNVGPYAYPAVPEGPCLAFGLHLDGTGYSELDMPLDGREGRPTVAELTDGRLHHVVATYDSFSGRKALYLDGELRFACDFEPGTLILSGGPAAVEIGNHGGREPFHGTLDEIAFYDFALRDEEIARHYQNVLQGRSYFGDRVQAAEGARWQVVTRLREGESAVFEK